MVYDPKERTIPSSKDKEKPSLQDRVDCYMNGILNYYFKWGNDRMDQNGLLVKAGSIIAPQNWTHELSETRRKPDFTISYADEKGAEDPFDFMWVEDKRPGESFFFFF